MRPKLVYVPTPVKCPIPNIPLSPQYPVITKGATPAEFVKWCIITNRMCRTDNKIIRAHFEGY
jgi:hypothetical protein